MGRHPLRAGPGHRGPASLAAGHHTGFGPLIRGADGSDAPRYGRVSSSPEWTLHDDQGKPVSETVYGLGGIRGDLSRDDRRLTFHEGRLPVEDESAGTCGWLGPGGERVAGFEEGFTACSPFVDGRAAVQVKGRGIVFVDREGREAGR